MFAGFDLLAVSDYACEPVPGPIWAVRIVDFALNEIGHICKYLPLKLDVYLLDDKVHMVHFFQSTARL